MRVLLLGFPCRLELRPMFSPSRMELDSEPRLLLDISAEGDSADIPISGVVVAGVDAVVAIVVVVGVVVLFILFFLFPKVDLLSQRINRSIFASE